MRTLITGAAGLLGSHLAELALQRADSVRLFVRPGEDVAWLASAGAEVCRGDVTDRASMETAVAGMDLVIHCAARMGPWGPWPEYDLVNIRAPRILTELAMAAGVQRIVHVSSIDVQGLVVGDEGVDETGPMGPERDPYCTSKREGELEVQRLIKEKNAPATIVRPGLIYGPRDTHSFARFVRLVEEGKMVIIGSGKNLLPLVYVRDAARGILLAAAAPHAVGKIYLVLNDESVTQSDYFNTIAKELGVPPIRWHVPYRLADGLGAVSEFVGHLTARKQPPPLMRFGLKQLAGQNRFVILRARKELGFSPEVNLAEGVRLGVAWYRQWKARQSARPAGATHEATY